MKEFFTGLAEFSVKRRAWIFTIVGLLTVVFIYIVSKTCLDMGMYYYPTTIAPFSFSGKLPRILSYPP